MSARSLDKSVRKVLAKTETVSSILAKYRELKQKQYELEKELGTIAKLVTRRKLQEARLGTFFVTLPRKWVQMNDLKKSDDVTIFWTNNNELIIFPR
jgi:hypothetical protein